MGRGDLKLSVLDGILTLTSAKPIQSVECSTSWALRSTGRESLCEFMVTRERWRSMYNIFQKQTIELRSQKQVWLHHRSFERYLINGWRRPENFRPRRNFNFDLCEIDSVGRVLYQLTYQVNWKRIIVWVHGNSWKMEDNVQYISKTYNWTAESERSLISSSQFWTLFNQWVEETWKFQSSTEFELWPLRNRFSR